jgi:hypothetical protein
LRDVKITYYSVLVIYEGNIKKAEERVAQILKPYDKKEVLTWKGFISKEQVNGACKHLGMKEKYDRYQIGGHWQGLFILKKGAQGRSGSRSPLDTRSTPLGIDIAYQKDLDFESIRQTQENELKDFWEMVFRQTNGGDNGTCWRGRGLPFGTEIREGDTINEFLRRHAKFSTHSVVNKDGWHEPSEMGEDENTWVSKYAERFLSNPTDKTVLVIVDCHK